MTEQTQKWVNIVDKDGYVHVLPDWDEQPHGVIDESGNALLTPECPCGPRIEPDNPLVVVHKSYMHQRKIDESMATLQVIE